MTSVALPGVSGTIKRIDLLGQAGVELWAHAWLQRPPTPSSMMASSRRRVLISIIGIVSLPWEFGFGVQTGATRGRAPPDRQDIYHPASSRCDGGEACRRAAFRPESVVEKGRNHAYFLSCAVRGA